MSVNGRIREAMRIILRKAPTLYPIVYRCPVKFEKVPGGYAATNGKEILLDPDRISYLSPEQLASILLHEALHIALGHLESVRRHRYPGTFNVASDSVINYFIHEILRMELPPSVVTMQDVARVVGLSVDELKKMSADEIYWLLLRHGKLQENTVDLIIESGEGSEKGGGSKGEEGERGKVEGLPSEEDVAIAIGRLSMFGIHVDVNLLPPKIDWKRMLRIALASVGRKVSRRWTWIRESRKLPGDVMGRMRYPRSTPKIVVAVDVSGSVVLEENLLDQFISEVVEVARVTKAKITLILWEAEVQGERTFNVPRREEIVSFVKSVSVGGGTDPVPALKRIAEIVDRNSTVILISDGLFYESEKLKELASKIASTSAKSIYVYTVWEHPKIFSTWVRIRLVR
jgi:predicted metal-dependent peptidase